MYTKLLHVLGKQEFHLTHSLPDSLYQGRSGTKPTCALVAQTHSRKHTRERARLCSDQTFALGCLCAPLPDLYAEA